MSGGARVTFHGVRGSTPCDGPQYARYGGNTSCVAIEADGHPPFVCDLGTGVREFGAALDRAGAGPLEVSVLLTHLHWDHVIGLPFFTPLLRDTTVVDVYGPCQALGPLETVFGDLMRPPYFPIRVGELGGTVRFHDTADDDFAVGTAKVRSRWVRHTDPALGFRVEWQGMSVVYLSDHGQGCSDDPDDFVPGNVLDLCDGADLLIHDAQHAAAEFERRRHWGHCTVDYALHVARESGVRNLALFHHDPCHDDDAVDRLLTDARERAAHRGGPEVFAASDGLVVELQPHR